MAHTDLDFAVKAGETVYLAPGAVVRGTITARGWNVRVRGRGIFSGELLQEEWMQHKRGLVATPQDARASGIDQETPWSAKIQDVTLREIDLVLERVTVTGTERGRWWGPFQDRNDREDEPMRSRLRTAAPGTISVLFDDVSINGVRLRSEQDFPNGLETQGDVRLEFR